MVRCDRKSLSSVPEVLASSACVSIAWCVSIGVMYGDHVMCSNQVMHIDHVAYIDHVALAFASFAFGIISMRFRGLAKLPSWFCSRG